MISGRNHKRRGSILVLVVAMLAVLFVTGIGFLAMTSVDRKTAEGEKRQSSLAIEADAAIQKIVAEIARDNPLSELPEAEDWDFPWTNATEADFGKDDDAWLAEIAPVVEGGVAKWRHISNLSGHWRFPDRGSNPNTDTSVPINDCEVDADMDGIKDSRWILSPSGRFRIAYRVIDMSGMMNLNVGGRGFAEDLGNTPYNIAVMASNLENSIGTDLGLLKDAVASSEWGGCYGRGANTSDGKGKDISCDYHDAIDNPFIRTSGLFPMAQPFRTQDTIALLSYGIKPGPVAPRFAEEWTTTFDVSRNAMPNIETATNRDLLGATDSLNLFYTCTSYTRNMRAKPPGDSTMVIEGKTVQEWEQILSAYDSAPRVKVNINGSAPHGRTNPHDPAYTRALVAAIILSGATLSQGDGVTPLNKTQVEQLVLNIVDFRDTDLEPSTNTPAAPGGVDTVFNSGGLYGIEPQVFFTEVGACLTCVKPENNVYCVELFNPYNQSIDLANWKIVCPMAGGGSGVVALSGTILPGGRLVVRNKANPPALNGNPDATQTWAAAAQITNANLVFGVTPAAAPMPEAGDIYLVRTVNGVDLTMDKILFDSTNARGVRKARANWLSNPTDPNLTPEPNYMRRGDREWMQARDDLWKWSRSETLGKANGILTAGTSSNDPYLDVFYKGSGTPFKTPRDGRETPIVASCLPSNPWVSGRYYALRQIVQNGGKNWMCAYGHSSVTFSTNRDEGKWVEYTSHNFDTLGQLHWMMLYGPPLYSDASPGTSVATRISDIDGPTRDLFVDFTRSDRGDWKILKNLTRMERRDNGIEDNGFPDPADATNPDDLDEWRQAGLINVNTATPYVMNYLCWPMHKHATDDADKNFDNTANLKWNSSTFYTFGKDIYDQRKTTNGFRKGIGEMLVMTKKTATLPKLADTSSLFHYVKYTGGNYYKSLRNQRPQLRYFYNGTDNYHGEYYKHPNMPVNTSVPPAPIYPPIGVSNYASSSPYYHHQATIYEPTSSTAMPTVTYDHDERHAIVDRVTDLVTTRSDVFLAYVLVEEIEGATATNFWSNGVKVVQRRRIVTLIDRSRCNYKLDDPNYRSPEIIARSVATW